ncbi:hypothetical protein [Streptomyces lydicus]
MSAETRCRWCPHTRHTHGQRYTPTAGWHRWTAPIRPRTTTRKATA